MSNGTTTDNEVEFGNSWKTDPDCEDATFVDHPCTTNPDRNATARANCSALRDSPFDKCSSYINPDSEGYISDCEYDVCACDDHPTVCLCQAIEAYVDDCASYGVNITWLSYPQYQQCTTPCASDPCFNGGTCTNIHSNFSCSCPVGFTGHRCEMKVDDCDDLSCGKNEVCVRVGDTFDCVCHQDYTGDDCKEKVEATCVTYGDPHYRTFDGKRFDFMGKCEYVLAKDRVNNTFEIRQENEPCGNGLVTCTKSITVIFPGLTIKLQRGMTNVNGGEISSSTNYGAVNVTIHGNGRTVVTSDYGVTVFWNNVYNVRVTIGGRYVNRTSGLCGTYNKMKYDDFWTPYGTIVGDPVEFGNSWKVDPTCENATTVDHPCDANLERRLIARENCSALLKPPFSNCSSYINATEEGYIADCEYDMCACEDDSVACYCQALQTYADDCSSDVKITWMNLEQFAICNAPCASAPCYNGGTCTDIDSSSFECRCPAGYIGARCENKDLCQIPYLFLSTSSGTVSYNTENSTSIPMKVDDRVNALLSYDAINRRYSLSMEETILYYYHELHSRIYVYNITSGQSQGTEVDALKDISSVKDLEMDTTNGYLYIARAGDPPIVRYNPGDNTIMEFNFDGSAQSISVDEYNNVIYWANYDGINHNVMKTSLNKQTIGLNISYPGAVELTSDVLNLYVLDTSNNRIDKYLKTSSEKQGNFTYHVTINDLIIAYGSQKELIKIH
ncbi:IgGFc-binding protein-like [Dendronephthya gigantea]|uniref:IgGFc-binding protein-like n=1 Tax=Dendronephthya gigantea TaxID=151771 RepID=UPI00106D93DB|nr:IgGFc-binding protein-like [Dendronephthya gigantea]